MAFLQRLKTLEKSQHTDFADVLELIKQGAYYDQLTSEQKERYCSYAGHDREAMEQIETYINGGLHFLLQRKAKPLTDSEFKQRVKEVEELTQAHIDAYNSPEAAAERQRQYEELQRIGAQRAAAFKRGESFANCPLPWEVTA